MLAEDLTQGDVKLERIGFSRLIELENAFEEPELHYLAARLPQFHARRLFSRLFGQVSRLLVYDIWNGGERAGYVTLMHGIRVYPHVTVFAFDETQAVLLTRLALPVLTRAYFVQTQGEALECIVLWPPPEGLVQALNELGYDETDAAIIDPSIERCFRIYRSTFDAYYAAKK